MMEDKNNLPIVSKFKTLDDVRVRVNQITTTMNQLINDVNLKSKITAQIFKKLRYLKLQLPLLLSEIDLLTVHNGYADSIAIEDLLLEVADYNNNAYMILKDLRALLPS